MLLLPAPIQTRRPCQCRKSHTPDASRTRAVAPEYQYVHMRRATQSSHKQAIEAAFLNEIDQLRP